MSAATFWVGARVFYRGTRGVVIAVNQREVYARPGRRTTWPATYDVELANGDVVRDATAGDLALHT